MLRTTVPEAAVNENGYPFGKKSLNLVSLEASVSADSEALDAKALDEALAPEPCLGS